MTLPDFADFSERARAQGYDEVLERDWPPGAALAEHTHPFAVDALVVRGEMWLNVDGQERRLVSGDTFRLDRNQLHSERYGPQGATYWVARRG